MSFEWTTVKLSEISKIVGGGTPSTSESSYWDGNIPWITPKDLSSHKNMYISSGFRSITEDGLKNSSAKLVPKDTVLFTSRAPIGYIAIASQPVCTNQGFKSLVLNEGYDSRFFYYLLKHHTPDIEARATGSTFKEISGTSLGSFEVSIPSANVQKQIADLLSALDDRISLLRETNATLEAIAQALFKSWFVNFDPVRAKAEGRKPEGIDEATAALFPDVFNEAELGMVPKGWQVEALDDIAEFLNGLALQKFPPTGVNDLPVIKIAQLRKGDTIGADLAAGSIKPDYVIQNGDVLFSWSGSLEVEIWCGGVGALNQHLFKVSSSRFDKWFYYLWTKHHLESFRQIAASKATTMGHIQRGHLSSAKVNVPNESVLKVANALFTPLVERIVQNALQANTLASLRDTLLPRLISGQLRIADAEAELEKVTA